MLKAIRNESQLKYPLYEPRKLRCGKGIAQIKPKQAKDDERHAYPMDQLIGWILMIFGILVEVNINRAQVLFNYRRVFLPL